MGYSTDFSGTVTVTPPLNEHVRSYLLDFSRTRQTSPDHGLLVVESPAGRYFGGNDPRDCKPGIWCHWIADVDGNLIWDEGEKTYNHAEWLAWIVEHLSGPDSRDFVQQHLEDDPRLRHFTHDHVLNGIVNAQGEDPDDIWRIKVVDNQVTTQTAEIVYPEDDIDICTWPETDEERERYTDWQYEVGNGETILGFRDWITHADE